MVTATEFRTDAHEPVATPEVPVVIAAPEPMGLGLHAFRVGLLVLAILVLAIAGQLVVLSGVSHRVAQIREFDSFRNQLAAGTAPTSSVTASGQLINAGTPVALIQIPALGVKEVVDEGTSSSVLESGPGHLQTSAFPGQAGLSVVYGRDGLYGGPFRSITSLRSGDRIVVTTGVGQTVYRVIDVRRAGAPLPAALPSGYGRLTLVTAQEHYLVPSGALYVDADAKGTPEGVEPAVKSIPAQDRPLGVDTSNLWELVFLVEGLIVISVGAVWSWHRWGRTQTWITMAPAAALIGYMVANDVGRLLPNLT